MTPVGWPYGPRDEWYLSNDWNEDYPDSLQAQTASEVLGSPT